MMRIVVVALALLLSATAGAARHFRGGDSMALVLSESTEDKVNESCDASNGQGCQRRLTEQDDGQQDVPPEFVPTHEWQDILPNQVIPPVGEVIKSLLKRKYLQMNISLDIF